MTQKLLEACSEVAGASLEQTTWLRRNLAVKPGPQVDIAEADNEELPHDQDGNSNENGFWKFLSERRKSFCLLLKDLRWYYFRHISHSILLYIKFTCSSSSEKPITFS